MGRGAHWRHEPPYHRWEFIFPPYFFLFMEHFLRFPTALRRALTTGRRRIGAGLLLGLWLQLGPAAAQDWVGLAQSNYGGTNNAYVNPSAIADARHRLYLNLVGGGANFNNTYFRLNLPQSPWSQGFSFSRYYLDAQGSGGNQSASVAAELRLPSLMVALGPRSALAFTNRVRGFAQAGHVSETLARLARYGLDEADQLGLANRLLEDNSFDLNLNTYHEYALTYARTLTPNTTHFFKAGVTLKYLVGLGGGYVLNDGTQLQVYGRDSLQLRTRQFNYGLTDYNVYGPAGLTVGSLFGGHQLGRGVGADLGLTYEWRPDDDQYRYRMNGADRPDDTRNQYRLRLGLALTDLGAIRYNNDQHVRQGQLASTRTVQVGQLDTLHFSTLQSVGPTLQRLAGLSSEGRQFTSYLPTALRLTADYRLAEHVYAGLLWTQNLLPARTIGSRTLSALALTPRVEFRRAALAVPLILANNYRQFQVGAMARLGPLIVGSDNLGGLFGIRTATGADAYFGLALALPHRRPKDRDGDHVSDQFDKCPKEKGTWETKGCPVPKPEPR